MASLVAQTIKRLPTMQETGVQSLGQEDLLEKEMAPHSSILAWKVPWMRKLVGCSSWGRKESGTTERLHITLPVPHTQYSVLFPMETLLIMPISWMRKLRFQR